MAITVAQGFTSLENVKKDISDMTDPQRIEIANFVNNLFYEVWVTTDTNRWLENLIVKTFADQDTYSVPSTWRDLQSSGMYSTNGGSTYQALNYDNEVGGFTVGSTLTGTVSGTTATIVSVVDYGAYGTLQLSNVSGDGFEDNEQITDAATGDALCSGVAKNFDYLDKEIPETGFGSSKQGYWLNDDNDIVITPTPKNDEKVFVFRYIPQLTNLTSTGDPFILPDDIRFKELLRNALLVAYDVWDEDVGMEGVDDQRFSRTLQNFAKLVRRTPRVMRNPSHGSFYTKSSSTKIINN